MSEERKKREKIAVDESSISTETAPLLTKQTNTSATEAANISNTPHLGLLILESYGSSVPTVNPDKVLLEYTEYLVSIIDNFF
jgi:hypothetical protein